MVLLVCAAVGALVARQELKEAERSFQQQAEAKGREAKGIVERKVLYKHAFKNAAIPLVTVMGMQFGLLLGGAVVTETVFAWPGLGRLAVDSIRMGDYPVVQAIVVVFAFCVILGNLAADTVVVHWGEIFGKPRDADHARAMLRRLNGERHLVLSGVTVME